MTRQRDEQPPCKVAIVGCGFFAPNHIHAWKMLPQARIVAVCDSDEKRAGSAAGLAGGVPCFTGAAQMLDAHRPDVVDVITTATSHLSLAELCAQRGIPAIIQKPLAPEFAEALRIADVARRHDVPMMVHENFRFQKPMRAVKAVLETGAIGSPRYCRIAFRTGFDIYLGQPYLRNVERFILMDNGVHIFDLARFFMGEIAGLSCRTQRVRADVRGEQMASALVSFTSGAMGVVEGSYASYLAHDPFPETLVTVEGSAGSVVLDRNYELSVRSGSAVRTLSAEPECPPWGSRPWHVVQDSVVEACRHWLDAASRHESPETSVHDNVRTLAAVEACYLSAANNGAYVAVDDVFAATGREPK